ncbi:bifunctional NAD(P)H-hydrate repair enzyme [Actinorhabdospora filicis]|uniref:Bifunctional NAD(P)H-hydrate repair enzyme n=1 Tax=Actinorhabdospora filicis TaxID=1785913 RepID=A0A9W6W7I0_9ACTN|nr:NAD(P)H-hydrate dehydratase [Actinorhabdospora filicis]GLZ76579.1 bifunctional NAD(P)H-hydrate repair enzyme [Actinorhabdospora filicis]
MRGAWRAGRVRAAEAALMATVPNGTLMQRAAAALARRAALMLDGVYGSTVLVLTGPGDNGGDALYAGARLARRGARVLALPLASRTHEDALADLLNAGGRVVHTPPSRVDLVIDGILGIGGRPGLREDAAAIVEGLTAPVLAVDLPSGVDVDTGDVPGPAVTADVTITFGCLKPALVVGPAAARAGLIEVADIGLGPYLDEPYVLIPSSADVAAAWRRPRPGDDKYTRGVLGIAAGSARYPGAARLAVAGALAGPGGYVRYAGPAAREVAGAHPEVVTYWRAAEAGRVQAWTVGPGLGTDGVARAELMSMLDHPVPVCVDADAITLLSQDPAALAGRQGPTVLTPHDREFARLFGREPGPDRVAAARELAERTGAVVLLKGHRTVVAAPDGRAYANPTGHPALSTAGSGDVLSGLLGSLLASGVEPALAAVSAAYLHGLAGARAAADGPVTAPRVADALREVVRDVVG